MKTTKLVSLWLTLHLASITLRYCARVLYNAYRGQLTRAMTDEIKWSWATDMLKAVKLRVHVINPQNLHMLSHRCTIIMSNHSSLFDIPLLLAVLPGSIRMLAKKELFRIPIFGLAMKKAEFLCMDRKNREQSIKDLEFARQKMESGIVLWIAPEGTRSRTGQLLPFKKGGFILALQAQAIIIPVGIRGARDVLPPDTLQFSVDQQVEIHVGEPISTAHYNLEQREQLMGDVRQQIHELASC